VKRVVDKSFVVRKVPPGPLSSSSRGTLRLANGITTTFEMTEFERLRHWKWAGRLLGTEILYDHIFSQPEPGQTTIRFTVDITGALGVFIGGIFGRIYRRNLERAIPLLVRQIEAVATSGV